MGRDVEPLDDSILAPPEHQAEARYELGELIGRGGMGEVRAAFDRRIGREVAIKTLFAGEVTRGDAQVRFVREARVQGLLEHPAIVPVHDLGFDAQERPFFVMKLISGVTLAEVLRDRTADEPLRARFGLRTLLARFADVCLAVDFAHSRGVVHRDLKPTNIMLGAFGEVWVLDWGVAKLATDGNDVEATRAGAATLSAAAKGLLATSDTVASTVLGTPGYVAPEQLIEGASADHRVDVYALGCVLFEILAGRPAHPRGEAAISSTLRGAPRAPSAHGDGGVPPELDAVCLRAMATAPGDRFSSVRELHDAVQAFLDGDRDLAQRRRLARRHVRGAKRALERGDRPTAMREAGAAMALDPVNDAAPAIVTRVMLEPPEGDMPDEAQSELGRSLSRAGLLQARALVIICAIYGLLGPALLWLGRAGLKWALAMLAGSVMLAMLGWIGQRQRVPAGKLMWVTIVGNALLAAVVSRVLSPLTIPAALATASVMAFIVHPVVRRPAMVIGLYILVVVGPAALEAIGVLPRTFELRDGGIFLHSDVVDAGHPATIVALFLFLSFHLISSGIFALTLHGERLEAQRQLHRQAWYLRSLVRRLPDDRDLDSSSDG